MQDFLFITQWWLTLYILGIIFLPLTMLIFGKFTDYGYSFSKVIGIVIVSYSLFVLSTVKILPVNIYSLAVIILVFAIVNFLVLKKQKTVNKLSSKWKLFLFEEALFFTGIAVWGYIRAHEPSINGLEKFMDFGFMNSVLRTTYLPATDMWFPPLSINYYYFGHFVAAILTKISFLPSYITYNLMIATLFSFTLTLSFSLVSNIIDRHLMSRRAFVGGIIGGLLVSLSGNLHILHSLFKPYDVDSPLPIWALTFSLENFPNAYWYPNATRFIPFTIHEFPLYSFVVSDLHGHVIDIMFALLGIALIYILFLNKEISKLLLVLIGFLLAIMYMTNAWDGLIYILLTLITIATINIRIIKVIKAKKTRKILFITTNIKALGNLKSYLAETFKNTALLLTCFFIFSLPFNIFFEPFASGIGVLCAPEFLVNIGKIGPLMFEADHCQKSLWWQLLTLYGFFYFFVISFLIFIYKRIKFLNRQDLFVLILITTATLLIIIPEFIYVKDIYPAHYRANTMFKLVYQSFILLSIASTYIIVRILKESKNIPFLLTTIILLATVMSYPYFAIKSYYGELASYKGLDGIKYLQERYPEDYKAIKWINENIHGQPVILEAQGDSYTDYARISSNTGLPTVLGWAVHEWLWRGTYDIPAPRIDEIINLYESEDIQLTRDLIDKYQVEYVYIGGMEKEKYTNLNKEKFEILGDIVFETGNTQIYKIQ